MAMPNSEGTVVSLERAVVALNETMMPGADASPGSGSTTLRPCVLFSAKGEAPSVLDVS